MDEPVVMLAAHGCGDESLTNRVVCGLAQVVGATLGRRVEAAFNLGTPGFGEVVSGASSCQVVPLMLAEGYFSREVLPMRIREGASDCHVEFVPALGTWERVRQRVVDRARQALGDPDPHSRVLVVGHGTKRHPESGATTCELSARIAREAGVPSEVAFLDDEPLLENVAYPSGERVVVVPWLLGGGGHALEDVPERLGLPATREPDAGAARHQTRNGCAFVLLPAILHDPALPQMICEALTTPRVGGAP